jgi:hypothetical protein
VHGLNVYVRRYEPCKEVAAGEEVFMAQSATPCKTVGSAYVGSNPTPATSKTPGHSLMVTLLGFPEAE